MENSRSLHHSDELDVELAALVAESRRLALSRFGMDEHNLRTELICLECRRPQGADGTFNRHAKNCKTGAILARHQSLGKLTAEQRAAAAGYVPASNAHDQADGYGEPFAVSADESVRNRDGRVVADLVGSDLAEADALPFGRRMAACLNFCAGMATEDIEGRRLIDYRLGPADAIRAGVWPSIDPQREANADDLFAVSAGGAL